ncbi:PREDICTED: cannabidiolic acid synthase-like 1 [Nelumbo nucifera]|uniref:FAD-binding PCMH-type domain-containing protein n=2 Tax=Nelumbo nucifera TaxID=4432 RepID=A0A822YXY4_NELNU|nr:PREDICTED: cannabidiolic acid synthase-like 1 [Nelumbo nucifera]DAD36045.1 TPA_asm: hypothetical protein HUJ06_006685 [Nelumbo nucifera]
MQTSSFAVFSLLYILLLCSVSWSWATSDSTHWTFLQCLEIHSQSSIPISEVLYSPNNSSYSSLLLYPVHNLRFSLPSTPKPLLLITPLNVSHIQETVICSRKADLQLRVRSGGHDYEGLSYVSDVPFIIVDLLNFRSVDVSIEDNSAWIQAGATLGEVYYRIAEASKIHGFPAGSCSTVGVGGHFSGGGFGLLFRKYGLAADNIIDAYLVDVNGRILNRESMGEDLFWAIRGGGGASFGIIVSWKVKLVPVPPVVTVFSVDRALGHGGTTKLIHKWQFVADKLHEDIFLHIYIATTTDQKGNRSVQASFDSMFLGGSEKLLQMMDARFPELGLKREDCIEMSWIQSVLYYAGFSTSEPLEVLLDRRPQFKSFFKAKSDFVKEPISETGLEGIWKRLYEDEGASMIWTPYGGKMNEIPESEIPFPHRKGNIYKIQYGVNWEEGGIQASRRHIGWIRKLYRYMRPYVSKSPRAAYVNYRDLDLGTNSKGNTSYSRARIWGEKYFKSNFKRLVHVKSMVDPGNFFRHEQSIPSWRS